MKPEKTQNALGALNINISTECHSEKVLQEKLMWCSVQFQMMKPCLEQKIIWKIRCYLCFGGQEFVHLVAEQ